MSTVECQVAGVGLVRFVGPLRPREQVGDRVRFAVEILSGGSVAELDRKELELFLKLARRALDRHKSLVALMRKQARRARR